MENLTNSIENAIDKWIGQKKFLNKSITESSVARSLHVTTLTFREYLQNVQRTNYVRWIEKLKADEAKRLMIENPEMSYADIASSLGFKSQHDFTVAFSLGAGCSPGYWKSRNISKAPTIVKKKQNIGQNTKDSHANRTNKKPNPPFDDEPIVRWKRNKGYCQTNLTPANVAKVLGFSETRFKQYISQVEGTFFPQWITKLRIEEAQRLLLRFPRKEIREIIKEVGYSSKGTFLGSFKKMVGCTPSEWRNRCHKKMNASIDDINLPT